MYSIIPNFKPDQLQYQKGHVQHLLTVFNPKKNELIFYQINLSCLTPISSFVDLIQVIYYFGAQDINNKIFEGLQFTRPISTQSILYNCFSHIEPSCLIQWRDFLKNPVVIPHIIKSTIILLPTTAEKLTVEIFIGTLNSFLEQPASHPRVLPTDGIPHSGHPARMGSINDDDTANPQHPLLPGRRRCRRCEPRTCFCPPCTIL